MLKEKIANFFDDYFILIDLVLDPLRKPYFLDLLIQLFTGKKSVLLTSVAMEDMFDFQVVLSIYSEYIKKLSLSNYFLPR